ncbi:MAG: FAD:protein FMN transferase [Acidimicrobiia bacterium]
MTTAGLHHVEYVMGMAVSIDIRDDIDRGAVTAVVDWLHHVDAVFSTYKMDSPISRFGLGEIDLDELAHLDRDTLDVLALCEELREDTGGAFDAFTVPAPNGAMFDPSGVVKGWSVERAAAILETHGAQNFCLNAGGDIVVRGETEPGHPWRIGVRHPTEPDKSAAVVELSSRQAIATSATYERGAHIIDPATGAPTADVASVTIVGPDLTFVDAYATAVFVMGVDGLLWLTERHPDHAGFVITHDGRTFATPNFG